MGYLRDQNLIVLLIDSLKKIASVVKSTILLLTTFLYSTLELDTTTTFMINMINLNLILNFKLYNYTTDSLQ